MTQSVLRSNDKSSKEQLEKKTEQALNEQRPEAAVFFAEKLFALNPKSAGIFLSRALFLSRDFARLIKLFSDSDDLEISSFVARAFFECGKLNECELFLKRKSMEKSATLLFLQGRLLEIFEKIPSA